MSLVMFLTLGGIATAEDHTVMGKLEKARTLNQRVLEALENLNDDKLKALTNVLRDSVEAQNELITSLGKLANKDENGLLQMMHPTLDIPVKTQQVTAWYHPAGGQIKVGQVVWRSDVGEIPFGNVNIGQVKAFANAQQTANQRAAVGRNAATPQPFIPAPVYRGGRLGR